MTDCLSDANVFIRAKNLHCSFDFDHSVSDRVK